MRTMSPLLVLSLLAAGCSTEPGPSPLGPPAGNDAGNEQDAGNQPDAAPDAPEETPLTPPTTFVATAKGTDGAAATIDHRATWAALETLKAGGNAVDAAVAASSMLGLTDPFSCGIGGGGFMLIYIAATGQVIVVDHREMTPAGMTHKAFYENNAALQFTDLLTSGLSVGVPGLVRGWDEALRRYGTMGFKDVFKYVIHVAEQGFGVDQAFFDQTSRNVDRFRQIDSTAKLYLTPVGDPHPVGFIFKNPDLAKVYEMLGEGGPKAFYEGAIASALVNTVKNPPLVSGSSFNARPGLMELADLAGYEARIRPAVKVDYRGYAVYGVPPPSSGGVTVELALNILEGFDPGATDEVGFYHRSIEASRLAYADRNTFIGDPEFVAVPVLGLLSQAYADARRPLIDVTQASTAAAAPGDPFAFQNDPSGQQEPPPGQPALPEHPKDAVDKETTHISVADKQGNIVAYTCTIEYEGGNGMVVPGYGFLLNNELTDFNIPADPSAVHANVLEPGKRPRSSMTPTMVFKDGKPFLTLGSPGGATIITTILQVLVNHIDLGMTIEEAIAAPRVSQRNAADATSFAEPGFIMSPEATALTGLGHLFSNAGEIGAATAIRFHEDGTLTAAAEPVRRGGGSAMVVSGK